MSLCTVIEIWAGMNRFSYPLIFLTYRIIFFLHFATLTARQVIHTWSERRQHIEQFNIYPPGP